MPQAATNDPLTLKKASARATCPTNGPAPRFSTFDTQARNHLWTSSTCSFCRQPFSPIRQPPRDTQPSCLPEGEFILPTPRHLSITPNHHFVGNLDNRICKLKIQPYRAGEMEPNGQMTDRGFNRRVEMLTFDLQSCRCLRQQA